MPAMAHRRAHAIMAVAAGAAVLAVAPAGAGVPDGRGKLEVAQTFAGAYDEGSVSYLRVRNGRRVVLRRSRPGPMRARAEPARRALPRGQLPAPLRRQLRAARPAGRPCSRRVRVFAGETSRVRAVTRPGEGCRMPCGRARGVPVDAAASGRRAGYVPRARPVLVRPDRLARPPARLRPAPPLRDRQRRQGDAAGRPAAPDRQPPAERRPTAPCSSR